MITFLPYPNFAVTAWCMDSKRLSMQRIHARQILAVLQGNLSKHRKIHGDVVDTWHRHPSVGLWRGHEMALGVFLNSMIFEYTRRGLENTIEPWIGPMDPKMPPWMGREDIHSSHRAALLERDPVHYSIYGWTEIPSLNYVWPTPSEMAA